MQVLQLGDQRLVRVLPFQSEEKQERGSLPTWLVLMDISGSMGQMVNRIVHTIIPGMAEKWGYKPDDPLELFLFESEPHRETRSVQSLFLRHGRIWKSMGCTYINPSLTRLCEYILDHIEEDLLITMFSDGDLHDLEAVHTTATQFGHVLNDAPSRGQHIVQLYRIGKHAATREMSAIGLMDNTQDKVPILDIHSDTLEVQLLTATECVQLGGQRETLTMSTTCMRRSPEEAPKSTLYFRASQGVTFLLDGEEKTLELNGERMVIPEATVPKTVDDIADILDLVESRVRYLLVVAERPKELESIQTWLTTVSTVIEDHANAIPLAQTSLPQRLKRLQKRYTSSILRIRELINRARVDGLNAQQQADFLRGFSQSAAGRRAAKRTEDVDWDERCRIAVKTVDRQRRCLPEPKEPEDPMTSFLSLTVTSDILQAIEELAQSPVLNNLSAVEIMSLVGLLGLPYAGRWGDLPDPWKARTIVWKVYHDCYLSQTDMVVCLTRHGTKEGPPLETATTREPIFGVIPVRAPHPEFYSLCMEDPTLNNLMASMCMRRTLAHITNDALCLKAAAAYRLCQEMVTDGVSEIKIKHLRWLWHDLRYEWATNRRPWRELELVLMTHEDPSAWFTGENNVSDMLKPWFLFFVSDDIKLTKKLVKHLNAFEVHHITRQRLRRELNEGEAVKERAHAKLVEILNLRESPWSKLVHRGLQIPKWRTKPSNNRSSCRKGRFRKSLR